MNKLKILLADPRHSTVGIHSNFVPINIGYIGSFIKKEVKDGNYNIETIDIKTIRREYGKK